MRKKNDPIIEQSSRFRFFIVGDSVAVYSPTALTLCYVFFQQYMLGAWVPVNIRNSVSTNAEGIFT